MKTKLFVSTPPMIHDKALHSHIILLLHSKLYIYIIDFGNAAAKYLKVKFKMHMSMQPVWCRIHKNCLFQEFSDTGKITWDLHIHLAACSTAMVS